MSKLYYSTKNTMELFGSYKALGMKTFVYCAP